MSSYTEINIKENMPTVDEAMNYLKSSVSGLRSSGCKCLLIVHGYGSTGKGGAIREKARQWLKAQERNKKVKRVIFGEDISIFNFDALDLKARHRELEPLFKVCNHGVTVVEL